MSTSTILLFSLASVAGWLPTGYRWNPGGLPIQVCITPSAERTELSESETQNEIRRGLNYWRSTGAGGGLSCSAYDTVEETQGCRAVVDLNDGQHNIFFESRWTAGSQTLGITHYAGFGDCGALDFSGRRVNLTCIRNADIELNDRSVTWDARGNSGRTDVASIVSHEFGHFLGLGHCNENGTCRPGYAVMYAAYVGGEQRVPQNDDVTGACSLYPGVQGGVGFPCSGGGDCGSGLCISQGNGSFCSAPCGSCPEGYACAAHPSVPNQTVCIRDDGTNKGLCETCQPVPNACRESGVCASGFSPSGDGRCLVPCPNPSAPEGGCPDKYTCYSFNGGGRYCGPKSSNCDALDDFAELDFGQACSASSPRCKAPYSCASVCTLACPQGDECPDGYGCQPLRTQTGGSENWCLPAVPEGGLCQGLVACPIGLCLSGEESSGPVCYRSCAEDPNVCNNAQVCQTYGLTGSDEQVSICEPPGVPPRSPSPDAGVSPNLADGGSPSGDGGPAAKPPSASCACDLDACCSPDCPCDTECQCACDNYYGCDPGCACDTECQPACPEFEPEDESGCSCQTSPGAGSSAAPVFGLLIIAIWFVRRRLRWNSTGATG